MLDEHFARLWQTQSATRVDLCPAHAAMRAADLPVSSRYADDFVVLVFGNTGEHAEAIQNQVATGPRPDRAATVTRRRPRWVHIDEGFDFLGFRIQRLPEAGHEPAIRLHLPRQEIVGGGET